MLTFKNLIHHSVVPLVSPAGSVTSRENDTQSFSDTLGFTTLPQRGRLKEPLLTQWKEKGCAMNCAGRIN